MLFLLLSVLFLLVLSPPLPSLPQTYTPVCLVKNGQSFLRLRLRLLLFLLGPSVGLLCCLLLPLSR